MTKKFKHLGDDFLITISGEQISYFGILKILVESANGDFFSYLEYKGRVTNDIVAGVTYEDEYAGEINEIAYLDFVEKLEVTERISENALIQLLPLSVHGDYSEPF